MKPSDYEQACMALHENACAHKQQSYIDPITGFSVFTSLYLRTRPCCKSACRHCPYEFSKNG